MANADAHEPREEASASRRTLFSRAEGRRYMTMLQPLPAAVAEVASGEEVLLQTAS